MNSKAFDDYWWVYNHPSFEKDFGVVEIEIAPHMVEPISKSIVQDHSKNTHLEWWIELKVTIWNSDTKNTECHHLWELDCGGDTIEEALVNLRYLTLEHYEDY